MAVAYDADVEVDGNSVGSLTTGSFTIAGSDRVGVAAVTWRQTAINISSVTIAGSAASAVPGCALVASPYEIDIYRVIAPATGSQTASVTFSNTFGNDLALHVTTFTGADQTTPCADGTNTSGTSTTPSVTVSNVTADDMVFDAENGSTTLAPTADAPQTQTSSFAHSNAQSGSAYQDGSDGGTVSWTLGFSANWLIAACRIVAAAAGGRASKNIRSNPLGVNLGMGLGIGGEA